MKTNICKVCFIIFFMFILTFNVKAETCSDAERNQIKTLGSKVQADYTLKKENDKYKFYINIYNIASDDISVAYATDQLMMENATIFYKNTNNGTYTFETENIDDIVTYKFTVRNKKCDDEILRSFSLIKPKRNKMFDNELCKYDSTKDFYYCKEWITNEFGFNEERVIEEIKKKINNSMKTTKVSEKIETKEEKEKTNNELKIRIIIGIVIAALVDITLMIIQYIRIKRYEI